MSLSGTWLQLRDPINPALHLPMKIPNDEHPESALSAPTRWKRDALQPSQVQHDTASRETCGHFSDGSLRCITWNTRGLVGSVLFSQKTRS